MLFRALFSRLGNPFLYPNQIMKSNRDIFNLIIMTTIQSTISSYSTEALLAFLLGNVNRQTKAEILEDAKSSRELAAYISYLQRLLETHDFDVEAVTKIAEEQMTNLVKELKKFNKELDREEPYVMAEATPLPHHEESQVGNRGIAQLETIGVGTTFSFAIAAHTNRLPPTDPLSITGLTDAKSPIYALTTAISQELKRRPLDEKGLENFLTVCRNQLQNRQEQTATNSQRSFWSPLRWWHFTKGFFILA
jgi:hypothetical protein